MNVFDLTFWRLMKHFSEHLWYIVGMLGKNILLLDVSLKMLGTNIILKHIIVVVVIIIFIIIIVMSLLLLFLFTIWAFWSLFNLWLLPYCIFLVSLHTKNDGFILSKCCLGQWQLRISLYSLSNAALNVACFKWLFFCYCFFS